MKVFDLSAVLRLDKTDYEKGLSSAASAAKVFSSKVAGFVKAGISAFTSVATAAVNIGKTLIQSTGQVAAYGDNIDKMSQKMGISAEAYQEWDAVMQHSGTSMETLKVSMRTLSLAAEKGNDAFKALGITESELANLSKEGLFDRVISGLQGMEEGTQRTAIASALLGRGATELGALLNTSAEETEAMRKRVHELGGVMSDEAVKAAAAYQDQLQDMNTAIDGFKRNIVSNFLPSVTKAMGGITNALSGDLEGGIQQTADAIIEIVQKAAESIPAIVNGAVKSIVKALPDLVKSGANIIKERAQGISSELPELIGVLSSSDVIPSVLTAIMDMIEAVIDQLPTLAPLVVEAAMKIIDMLTEPEVLTRIVEIALDLTIALIDGIWKALPKIIEALPKIVENLIKALLQSIPKIVDAGIKLFTALVQDAPAIIRGIVKAIPQIIAAIFQQFASFGTDLGKKFYEAWENIKKTFTPANVARFFVQVWDGIKSAFASVGEWFYKCFGDAWSAVKDIFAPVGEMFGNIGRSILNGLSSVINGIIWGINQVIKVPFDGLNGILRAIRDINIAGLKPFSWVGEIPVPQIPSIPMLAEGGVLKRGQVALLEGQGDEAVIPLSQNTEWIDKVADKLNKSSEPQNIYYTINIDVASMIASSQQDIENLADMLMSVMAEKTARKGAAW